MDLNHLSLDEIQVECEVRNILGSSAEQFKQLNDRLTAEAKRLIPDADKIHPRAAKSLNYEFSVCVNKIKDLKEKIESILTSNNSQINQLLSNCRSRGLHVFKRLKRIISYSPKYAKRATNVQDICENLLLLIEKVLSRTATADESLTILKEIQTSEKESEVDESDDQDDGSSKHSSSIDVRTSNIQKPPLFKMPNLSVPPPGCSSMPVASQDYLSHTFPPNHINSLGKPKSNTGANYLSSTHHISPQSEPKEVESRLAEISALINELKTDFSQPSQSSRKVNEKNILAPPPPNSNFISNRPNHDFERYKPLPINQWGISFNGVSDKISIERFLNRAEFLAEQNRMPLEHLSVNLVTIMSGVAREYCWLVHETHHPAKTPWLNLKSALIHRFKSSLNDYDIKGVMKTRKQNYEKNESFAEFFSDILGMSLSLNRPLSEPDLVNLLIENMRPGLHIELAGETFRNVTELEARCRAKEKAWNKQGYKPELSMRYPTPGGQFRRNISELPQETNNLSQLIPGVVNFFPQHQTIPNYGGGLSESQTCPTFYPCPPLSDQSQPHYHMPGVPNPAVVHNENFQRNFENNSAEYNVSAFNPSFQNQQAQGVQFIKRPANAPRMKCYNCDNWGHSFLDCSYSNSGDFCTMCGKKGVLKPNCPSCWSRVGNYQPGVSMVGNTHLPGTAPMPPNSQKPNLTTLENQTK